MTRTSVRCGSVSARVRWPRPWCCPNLETSNRETRWSWRRSTTVADRSMVPCLPVTADLLLHRRIAVEGAVCAARGLVRAMVCQLAVLHGPDVLAVTAVGSLADPHWDWMKWLPHHRHSWTSGRHPHHVVIVDGAVAGADAHRLGSPGENVTVLAIGQLTPHCLRLDVDDTVAVEHPDSLTTLQAVVCARRLAPFSEFAAPAGTPTWPDMVGIGDPGRLDVGRAWRPQIGSATSPRCHRCHRGGRRGRTGHQGGGSGWHGAARAVRRRHGIRQVGVPSDARARAWPARMDPTP